MKYYTMHNVGTSKYVLNSWDGIQTHKDGSPFYGVECFKNKRLFKKAIKDLENKGYKPK